MSNSKKIKVPATTVQLVQILGGILRDYIKIYVVDTECWTFDHVANWETKRTESMMPPSQASDGGLLEQEDYEYQVTDHRMAVYLGSGKCRAMVFSNEDSGVIKSVELRVRCQRSEWVAANLHYWDIQIWMKIFDSPIERYHYECFPWSGNKPLDATLRSDLEIPKLPPRKIAFWRKQETSPINLSEPARSAR